MVVRVATVKGDNRFQERRMGGNTPGGTESSGSAPSDFQAPASDGELARRFETRRRGLTDPPRQVAAEMQNITEALLEIIKYLRQLRNAAR